MGGACICLLVQEAMHLSSGYSTSVAIATLWVRDGTLDEHHDKVAALTQSIKA